MKLSTPLSVILMLVFFVSTVFADAVWNETYDPPKKIMVKEDMNFRIGPGTQYSRKDVVKKGSLLHAAAMKDGWYEVPLDGGGFGYIYKRFVTPEDDATASGSGTLLKSD